MHPSCMASIAHWPSVHSRRDLTGEALDFVEDLPEALTRSYALEEMAEYLEGDLVARALRIAAAILDHDERAVAFGSLCAKIPGEECICNGMRSKGILRQFTSEQAWADSLLVHERVYGPESSSQLLSECKKMCWEGRPDVVRVLATLLPALHPTRSNKGLRMLRKALDPGEDAKNLDWLSSMLFLDAISHWRFLSARQQSEILDQWSPASENVWHMEEAISAIAAQTAPEERVGTVYQLLARSNLISTEEGERILRVLTLIDACMQGTATISEYRGLLHYVSEFVEKAFRAAIMEVLVPQLPDDFLDSVLLQTLTLDDSTARARILRALGLRLASFASHDPGKVHNLWTSWLHEAGRGQRKQLLHDFAWLVPFALELKLEPARAASSIEDVCRWWP